MALFTSREKEVPLRASPGDVDTKSASGYFPSPLPMTPRAPQQNPIFSPFPLDS